MTRPTNFVSLTGRLVADPEIRSSSQGTDWASMRIAVDVSGRNQKDPENKTGFFNVTHFIREEGAGPAVQTSKLIRSGGLKKGTAVQLVGELQHETYETRDQKTGYSVSIIAETIAYAQGGAPRSEDGAAPAAAGPETIEEF